jgi:hypothetical protein
MEPHHTTLLKWNAPSLATGELGQFGAEQGDVMSLMIQPKGELLAYLLIIHRLAHARHESPSWPAHPA